MEYKGPRIKIRAIMHYYEIGDEVDREYLTKILSILLIFYENSVDFLD